MFEQQERRVVADVTAGVLVHRCHQGVQCLVAVGCEKRRFDRVFWEEVSVLVTAFDEPVGVEQQPVAGRPAGGERGEVILQAKLCGDAPLSNFGLFASPEPILLFDLNDVRPGAAR